MSAAQDTAPAVFSSGDGGEVVLTIGFTRNHFTRAEAQRIARDLLDRSGGIPEGPTNPKTQIADLDRILELTVAARQSERSPMWKTNMEKACHLHEKACNRLWEELDRQVDCRRGAGAPVKPHAPKPDDAARALRRIKREVLARLVESLPSAIADIMDEMEHEFDLDDD